MIQFFSAIIFLLLATVIVLLLLWIIKILFYMGNLGMIRKIFIFFFIIASGAGFSYFVFNFLANAEFMQPIEITEIIMPRSLVNFPVPPRFIRVDNYYFSGFWSIHQEYTKSPYALWLIFCENDIIGIGWFEFNQFKFNKEQKECFLNQCSNPYYALLPIFEIEEFTNLEKMSFYIINKFNPQCNFYE